MTAPGALAVRVPLLIVARAVLESVHWVAALTSWVVPSLRWATAFRIAEPPTGTVEGVAVIVSESRVWDEGLPHPVTRIKKRPHRSPKHTRGIGEIRIDCLVNLGNSNHRGLGMKAISRARTGFRVCETR